MAILNTDQLPATIGVYIFKNKGKPIYIGKSINIRARVKSHQKNAAIDKKERAIIEKTDQIKTITVSSELQALLLESALIKKYRPRYNKIWKDDKNYLYIKITVKEKYPKVFPVRKENKPDVLYFGPFSSVKTVRFLIKEIRKIYPFCTEKKISSHPCFYSKIGLCNPCPNWIEKISDREQQKRERKRYLANIRQVIKIFRGKTKALVDYQLKKLRHQSEKLNYEEAMVSRDKIFLLNKLVNSRSSLPADLSRIVNFDGGKAITSLREIVQPFFNEPLKKMARIEAYDISNLGFDFATGSMVVAQEGHLAVGQYRRFKVKSPHSLSDFNRLKEVITRRFHNKFPKPDLIIVDGGRPQVKVATDVIKKMNLNIPVIGLAKNPDRLIIGKRMVKPAKSNPGFNLARLLRDESHRFAKKYHLFLRKKSLL